MNNRGLTNLLLAIIAGVLLFGKDAMVSGLQGFSYVAVAIAVVFAILALCGAIASWIRDEWHAASNLEARLSVIASTAAGFILTPLAAYLLWLGLTGVPNPLRVAINSWLGWAWAAFVLSLMTGYGLYGLRNAFRWLRANRSNLPSIILDRSRTVFWGYLDFVGGPVTFSLREWRERSSAGAGAVTKIASVAFATVIGLMFSLTIILLTFGFVAGMLSWAGAL
ncbi:MAG: hypothetical protein E5X34_26995 [Mesorhizobium sp.]|uniref:hypothetical protein n=1 Tax=Mesorhizobium sp. TaxID=1871066 RepID=UPI0012236722|nr:hypothetical protein [Mesorhizobium sp.]TIR15967.1 MAG: hypothetical protein E5X34_26995 [Mesorhizobium sp.]